MKTFGERLASLFLAIALTLVLINLGIAYDNRTRVDPEDNTKILDNGNTWTNVYIGVGVAMVVLSMISLFVGRSLILSAITGILFLFIIISAAYLLSDITNSMNDAKNVITTSSGSGSSSASPSGSASEPQYSQDVTNNIAITVAVFAGIALVALIYSWFNFNYEIERRPMPKES
jgi:hypothetical protein